MDSGGAGAVEINGAVSLSSGTLTAPSGDFTVSGDFDASGGTFNHNSGTVKLDGASHRSHGRGRHLGLGLVHVARAG